MEGRFTTRSATPGVNALADGFLSTVNDTALVEIADLRRVSVLINRVTADNEEARASKNLALLAAGRLNTVVEARLSGAAGNSITIAATGDRSDSTTTIQEVGTAVTIHYDDDVSTVAQVEAAINASSTLIRVKTPGTGATILDAATDNFTASALAGGDGGVAMTIEKTVDGENYSLVATVTQSDFPSIAAGKMSITLLRDANGMDLIGHKLRVTLTSLEDNTAYSVLVQGEVPTE